MNKKVGAILKLIGIAVLIVLFSFLALVLFPFKRLNYPSKSYDAILISNISIINVEEGTVDRNQNVLVRGNEITDISGSILTDKEHLVKSAKVIDGRGKFLIPAFWDMHVHLTARSPHIAYPKFVSYGITHVRDMRGAYNNRDPFAGVQNKLMSWNKEVEDHVRIGPRLHGFTSFAIEGPHTMFKNAPAFFNCATPEQAIQLVRYFVREKVTLIKVYDNIPRDAFLALLREAKKSGLDVAGHKPLRVSTIEAADAGMKSMEHARFFIWDAYADAEEVRRNKNPKSMDNTTLRKKMVEEQDTLLLREMFNAFKRNNTWYCPTHLTRRSDAFADDQQFRKRYDSINPLLRFLAFEDLDGTIQEDNTALGRQVYKDFYSKGLEISGKASKVGIKLLAGSDTPELPGSSLHEELQELSKGGLSNAEVLRAATLYPAQYYKLDSLYGSIKKGRRADFVLLSANPLSSVENTKAVVGVIFDGNYIDEAAIKSLKRTIEKREVSWLLSAKLVWDMILYLTI